MDREIYERYHASYKGKEDIHTKLMKRYEDIPSWWFYLLLILTVLVSLILCIFLKHQVQLPWWGLLFAAAMAFLFTLPISIITATTNQVSLEKDLFVYSPLALLQLSLDYATTTQILSNRSPSRWLVSTYSSASKIGSFLNPHFMVIGLFCFVQLNKLPKKIVISKQFGLKNRKLRIVL